MAAFEVGAPGVLKHPNIYFSRTKRLSDKLTTIRIKFYNKISS